MVVDDDIRGLIVSGNKEDEKGKYDLALKRGMVPLVVDGLVKAAKGITSLSEISTNVNSMDIVKYQSTIRKHLTRYAGKLAGN